MRRRTLPSRFSAFGLWVVLVACGGAGEENAPPASVHSSEEATRPVPPSPRADAGEGSDASTASLPPLPESCDGWSAAYTCWRIGKAGGPDAARAAAGLREVCKRRDTIEACAPALDLLGATLPPEEVKKAAAAGCNLYAQDKVAMPLQAAACAKSGDLQVADGKRFLALDAYDKGCTLGSQEACDAEKRVHAELAAEGRDLEQVQFPIGAIREPGAAYRLNDVGCGLEKSAGFREYFSELGAPFFKKKKELVACIGKDASVPVYWRGRGGKIIEVHAKGAPCVEKILVHTPYALEVACGAVLMSGAPARAEDAKKSE